MTHDYTRKRGVVHTEILLPPHAPPSFSDRSTLWNSVELYEKAGNAQLAREIDAALPIELSREDNKTRKNSTDAGAGVLFLWVCRDSREAAQGVQPLVAAKPPYRSAGKVPCAEISPRQSAHARKGV